jgi:hypothetical protein
MLEVETSCTNRIKNNNIIVGRWCVTRIFDVRIDGVYDEIEVGFETGITIAFGSLFRSLGEPGQKGQDLIRGYGVQFSIAKFV